MGMGIQLEKLLNEVNMNVNEFSKLIGVRPQRIYNIIARDTKNVNKELIEKIADAFSVPVHFFYSGASIKDYFSRQDRLTAYAKVINENADRLGRDDIKIKAEFLPLKSTFNDGANILLLIFDSLNKDGKKELIKRASELNRLVEYTRERGDQEKPK